MDLGLTPLSYDARGVPQLLRASKAVAAPGATATESALKHVSRMSSAWGVASTALPTLQAVGEVPAPNAKIVRVRQSVDGLPVHGGEMRVMVRDNGELVAAKGVLVSADTPRQPASYPIDDTQAVARAVAHNFDLAFAPGALTLKERRNDGSRIITGRHDNIVVEVARAQRMWHHSGAMMIPTWVVEAYAGHVTSTHSDAFRTVLSADGRRVLSHRSLVSDIAFNYRVFAETAGDLRLLDGPTTDFSPHPTGVPDGSYPTYVPSVLVSVDGLNHPNGSATPDPWLPSTRTETNGNNVEAYTDLNAPSGLTFGDFRATTTSTRTFDRAYNTAAGPLTSQGQQMAAIASAFYGINWLHDFWYDAGFTEAAGNAQDNNYGRGGEDRDAMLAETQDNALGGSLNNANMSTPSDGLQPRMQIFVWSGKDERSLNLQPVNRTPPVGGASFGPPNFDTTAPIILGVDGAGAANDGCEPLTNTVTGRIVLVDRGTCSFKTKALNIQNAGGVGMLLANNAAGSAPPTLGDDATITTPITIGSLSVTLNEGNAIKADLGMGALTGTAHRLVGPQLDGSLDSTLLAHEFGHYLHHRLQDCGTQYCGAISEGWGDFLGLMQAIRDGDNYDGAYAVAVYSTASFTDPAYFGIRRAPYSVNPAINSLSFRHMSDGVPLPTTHPFLPGGANSQVHNAGEIWASTMHEVYVALLKAPGATFTDVRAKMAKYVVSGLLMAPSDGTPTEMRDALLSVASDTDRPIMIEAFARRGLGSCAISADRNSFDLTGSVESAVTRGRAGAGAAALDDSVESCDDDHILDAGETAKLSLPVTNTGHAALADVKITVSSTTPGVTIVTQPVMIASFAAGASQDLEFEVKLDKAAEDPIAGEFTIKVEASNGCESEITATHPVRLNVDDVPASSATDSFDATSIWTATGAATPLWNQIAESALDRAWHAPNFGSTADYHLVSPAVTVGTAAPFRVTFAHKYQFEFDGTAWDGGVIEYSTNNGETWADVATIGVAPGYTHTITTLASNPLGGRMAFSGQNASYPNTDTVTLDFGTQLAGMTVKLRYRIGTDELISAEGWTVDDVAFEGINGTPFPTQVEDRTACNVDPMPMPMPMPDGGMNPNPQPMPPPDEEPGCCDARTIHGGNLLLVVGVLGLMLVRRRRRR